MGPPPRTGHENDERRDLYSQPKYDPAPSSDAADAEHESDYTHAAVAYGQNRNAYGYNVHSTPSSSIGHDQTQVSPDLTGSPTKGAGRSTPRTAGNYGSYSTPQRGQQLPTSNLYNVMSDGRVPTTAGDMYSNGYASQSYPITNGSFKLSLIHI